jgi:hypothetical protein
MAAGAEAENMPDVASRRASRPPTPPDIVENRMRRRMSIPPRKLTIDDFELIKTLGTGAKFLSCAVF